VGRAFRPAAGLPPGVLKNREIRAPTRDAAEAACPRATSGVAPDVGHGENSATVKAAGAGEFR